MLKQIKHIAYTLIVALIFGFRAQAQNNAFAVQTTIKNGIIEGNYDTETGIQTYFGIPFAKPPVGNLRWRAPQPAANWLGVKTCKAFGPRPMQKLVWNDMHSRSNGVSEDCLTLNVWTPAKRNTKNLPVLLYYYGGGNIAGDASEPRYDGHTMAKKGIVVVTCNYRLNVFGFLAHPELSAEAPYKASGNYGFLDQQLALKWVKDNIARFGGDPAKITIAGESAGSIAVSYHMVSPLSRSLIAGAIGESGAGIRPTLEPQPLPEAEKKGIEFLTKAQLKSIAELRKLPARDIYEMYDETGRIGFPTVIDGYFLPKTLPEIYAAKQQAQVPLLLGWNSAESNAGAIMAGIAMTPENYTQRIKALYPAQYTEVLKLYPGNTEYEVETSALALASDRFIGYSTWKWADLHAKNSTQPVYRYLYAKLRPTASKASSPVHRPALGAPHASEIEYCMGNLHLIHDWAWTPADHKTSETMNAFFANFIKTGNPNATGLPTWPSVSATEPTPDIMLIDTNSQAQKASNDDRYRLQDKLNMTK
jgi:para-nitrobenzyl esterase